MSQTDDTLLIALLEFFREGAFPPTEDTAGFESYTTAELRDKYIAALKSGLLIAKGQTRDRRYKTSALGLKLLK